MDFSDEDDHFCRVGEDPEELMGFENEESFQPSEFMLPLEFVDILTDICCTLICSPLSCAFWMTERAFSQFGVRQAHGVNGLCLSFHMRMCLQR